MQALRRFATAAAVATLCAQQGAAQGPDGSYTDPKSGIKFPTYQMQGNIDPAVNPSGALTFGMVLPADAGTKDANEYIGVLRCASVDASGGWCGISHGESGQMTQALLLMAWPYKGEVLTSFRFVGGYTLPPVYNGDAKLTQISSTVNGSSFEVVYRCQNCFSWGSGGQASTLKVKTSEGFLVLGRAAAAKGVTNAECPARISYGFHDLGYGQYGVDVKDLVSSSYSSWAPLATKTPANGCPAVSTTVTSRPTTPPSSTSSVPSATPTVPASNCPSLPANKAYDYIIVGAGAGGIPIADRLSEAGASVLLIEKGPPSSGRYGGTMKPGWLQSTNLTRFDVPGLCNEIWHNSTGVACTDTDQMAGCVLGGGVAVNAGLWWKPPAKDWDENFPRGWKARDTTSAVSKTFQRIPGTWVPSQDGKLYRQEGFNALSRGLKSSGWKEVDANTVPNEKNFTYSHSTFMFSGGERGGPMATYLWTASQRKSFTLIVDSAARRVVRTGGHVTGVELECGKVIPVTANTGRVIVSAGTFGSAKFLLRSGIGPADQLAVVKGTTDGPTYINSQDYIELPVGYNLNDHVNTDTIVDHPDVVFYDFYEAYETPILSDKNQYLTNRSGILAQAAPNIGPLMWEEIKGSDGKVRQLQWTARVEGTYNTSMTISLYLGRGSTSRGRMTIQPDLGTFVSTPPYLRDNFDKEAVIQGINHLRATLKTPGLRWLVPRENQTTEEYVNSLLPTPGQRRANHWTGTNKLGLDDGRNGGTSVVDTNTKVYGTDNLFVVDASIFPGMVTGNPSAMIVAASEHAATLIQALEAPRLGRNLTQCGGRKWTGSFSCARGLACQFVNRDLSICAAPGTSVQSIKPEDVVVEA